MEINLSEMCGGLAQEWKNIAKRIFHQHWDGEPVRRVGQRFLEEVSLKQGYRQVQVRFVERQQLAPITETDKNIATD
ncbi:hypothetical protein P5G61_13200 [Paenibacillus sp. F6_3S_P_1C]|uniref:Uncharacterized protein n=1 Tax=Paenibacillus vandeheii TaxID=3035917 RepID=A0ABT8JAQ5_9BACL|nr:hypothetical protein [Paenibacillus vandeheii]MDN4602185.1 hypothetical protein [Paenibacillus vandeheii]